MFASAQAPSSTVSNAPFLPTMAKRTHSEASEPVTKEAVVISIDDFDVSLFAAKARGLKKDGQRVFTTSYNHKRLHLNLTPVGKGLLEIKYRVQQSDYAQNDNRMKVKFVVGEKVMSIINSIEEEVKKAVMPMHEATEFHSSLKDDVFSANLVLESKSEDYLSQCRVRPFQKDVIVVAGKEKLQPLLKENAGFVGGKARIVVSLDSIWVMTGSVGVPKVGLDWKIHTLMVSLPEQIRYVVPDVFADASWDEFDEE